MPGSNEIHARVAKVLVDALGVDENDIKSSASLQGDLGAESIDFLDIVFRLEREFRIKIRQGELFPDTVFQDTEILRGGRVTNEGLTVLRAHLPFADFADLERDRRLNRIDDLFTVGLLSSFVRWKLRENRDTDSDAHTPAQDHVLEQLTTSAVTTGISS